MDTLIVGGRLVDGTGNPWRWADVALTVKRRFPDAWTPGRSDLCFATTNRQSALMAMVERCDAMVVIGSVVSIVGACAVSIDTDLVVGMLPLPPALATLLRAPL